MKSELTQAVMSLVWLLSLTFSLALFSLKWLIGVMLGLLIVASFLRRRFLGARSMLSLFALMFIITTCIACYRWGAWDKWDNDWLLNQWTLVVRLVDTWLLGVVFLSSFSRWVRCQAVYVFFSFFSLRFASFLSLVWFFAEAWVGRLQEVFWETHLALRSRTGGESWIVRVWTWPKVFAQALLSRGLASWDDMEKALESRCFQGVAALTKGVQLDTRARFSLCCALFLPAFLLVLSY